VIYRVGRQMDSLRARYPPRGRSSMTLQQKAQVRTCSLPYILPEGVQSLEGCTGPKHRPKAGSCCMHTVCTACQCHCHGRQLQPARSVGSIDDQMTGLRTEEGSKDAAHGPHVDSRPVVLLALIQQLRCTVGAGQREAGASAVTLFSTDRYLRSSQGTG
jgi:hypothetical protein